MRVKMRLNVKNPTTDAILPLIAECLGSTGVPCWGPQGARPGVPVRQWAVRAHMALPYLGGNCLATSCRVPVMMRRGIHLQRQPLPAWTPTLTPCGGLPDLQWGV